MQNSLKKMQQERTYIRPNLDGPSARVEVDLALAIHEHKLLPGMKLREDELCEIYGVSRTVIRSALQSLHHSQLIELKRNRGAFVSKPSVDEAREVFEARSLIEPYIAFEAAKKISDAEIEALEAHMQEEHRALLSKEHGKAVRLSGQFHIEIARISNHTTLQEIIEKLVARSSLIIALYWGRKSALCEKHAHNALMDAFRNRDAKEAKELMQSHLVDIASALDLRTEFETSLSLRDILKS